jgi:hypothetical protein
MSPDTFLQISHDERVSFLASTPDSDPDRQALCFEIQTGATPRRWKLRDAYEAAQRDLYERRRMADELELALRAAQAERERNAGAE